MDDTSTAPFIFIGTHRPRQGRREAFLKYFTDFTKNVVEPQEPRLHAFYGYVAPDSDLVTVVQVHPDAASMMTHMQVGREHFASAYAEYLEPESTMHVYGTPTPDLLEAVGAAARFAPEGASGLTVAEPWVGFHRFDAR